MRKTTFRPDIQVLRGLSVLAVVLFHADEKYFPLGYLGVDIFFVISGFVVTPLILRIFTNRASRLSNLRYFYKRRFFRLAPAMAASLSLFVPIVFLFGPAIDHEKIGRQGIATLLLAGNVGANRYSGDYFSPNPNPLIHTWSLSVEEQVYFILPIILILILHNRKSIGKITAAVLALMTVFSLISFLFPKILQPLYLRTPIGDATQFSFYSPIERLWEFSLGGLVYLFLKRFGMNLKRLTVKMNSVLTFAVFTILLGSIKLSPKIGSVTIVVLAISVIIFKSLDVLPKSLTSKLVWLGDRSYSIYLVHLPILYTFKYSYLGELISVNNQLIQSILTVVTSILLGAVSYSKIECRFRNVDKAKSTSPKTIAVSLMLTVLLPIVLLAGLDRSYKFGLQDNGLPIPSTTPPWDWDIQCQFEPPQNNIKRPPCKYGNNNSGKTIFLIGDSHAASISQTIIDLGKLNSMDVYVFPFIGCGFVLNENDLKSPYSYPWLTPDCLMHNQSILNFVKNSKPTVIIWGHRSSSIMVSPNTFNSRTQYNQILVRNLSILMKEDIPIINIGSVPELSPVKSRVQGWLNYKPKFSTVPFEDNFFWESKNVTDYYLNTVEIFCPRNICSNKSTEGWLFHDASHLSKVGANLLVPGLDRMIKEILNKDS